MVEEWDDVLVYTSPRLLAPVTIAGPVAVTLCASSSTPDTDFTAKLLDVESSRYCTGIAEGISRTRYRLRMDREELLTPGNVVALHIDLLAVARTFQPGHRIRLERLRLSISAIVRNLKTAVEGAGPHSHCAEALSPFGD